MARKVYVNVTVRLIINADEGESIETIISNMDYNFTCSESDNATIEDSEITGQEITDSK